MQQEDIIYGGEGKLRDTVTEAWEAYHPKLILIISSPVSDILNEDTYAVAKELREERGIPVISVKSELFSHRDKSYSRRHLKALADQKITGDNRLEMELKGCGFTEVLYALVDQVMEPCAENEKSINIETVGWGSEGIRTLPEIREYLERAGIAVNTYLPSTDVELIKRAPSAQLNVAKRVRWARRMKEKYGTKYIHANGGRYRGLDGICNFYQDIADALGLGEQMAMMLEEDRKEALRETEADRKFLGDFRCTLVSRSISGVPFAIKSYIRDYGFSVDRVCLIITEDAKRTQDMNEEVMKKLLNRVQDACRLYGNPDEPIRIWVNPDEREQREALEGADLIIGTDDFTMEGQGAPVIPEKLAEMSWSFASYVRSVKRIRKLCGARGEKKELLLNKMNVTRESYPLPWGAGSTMARELWYQMWLNKYGEDHAKEQDKCQQRSI